MRGILSWALGIGLLMASSAQTPAPKPAPTSDGITAGRQFGRVKIGMSRAEVLALLKAPVSEAQLEGDVTESVWHGSARKGKGIRKKEYVAVYFFRETVIQIDGTSPRFALKSGLSTKSTWAKMAAHYKSTTTRKRSYPLDDDQPRLLHFAADDSELGIGWVQVQYEKEESKPVPSAPIDVIVVHRPGTRMLFGAALTGIWVEPPHANATKPEPSTKPEPAKTNPPTKGPQPETKPTKPKEDKPIVALKPGDLAPALIGKTAAGQKFDLKEALKGSRGALVHFWFGSSDDCKKLLPHIQEYYSQWGTQGLVVVGVNVGDRDAVDAIRTAKVQFPNLIDTDGSGPAVDFRVLGFPTTFLIGADGKVIAVFSGPDDEPIKKALEKLGFSFP